MERRPQGGKDQFDTNREPGRTDERTAEDVPQPPPEESSLGGGAATGPGYSDMDRGTRSEDTTSPSGQGYEAHPPREKRKKGS